MDTSGWRVGNATSGGEQWLLVSRALGLPLAVLLRRLEPSRGSGGQSSGLARRPTLAGFLKDLFAGDLSLPGVGPAALERLAASLDLAELIALESALDEDPISNPAVCERLLRLHFSGASRESFCCLLLNGANRLIGLETLFCGTVDGAAVYPRVVVERALRRGAAAVIAAHNHPSGQLTPSQSDIRITERLRSALALVDIRLLDHLIVGSGRCVSLAERGYC